MRLLVIDGYNVMRRVKRFEDSLAASLESARSVFVAAVAGYVSGKGTFDEAVIVFDGSAASGTDKRYRTGPVSILFSRFGESGDDAIRKLLAGRPAHDRVTVVSDDNYVTNNARAHRADTMSCAAFAARLRPPVRHRGPVAPHEKDLDRHAAEEINAFLRREWGIG